MRPHVRLLVLSAAFVGIPGQATEPVGWRMDGTGRYPHADPPREWGPDKNVVWKTKMPNFSVATPIIVGERIFICSEPTTLICVNKADGAILWEKKSTRDELTWTAADKAKLSDERELAKEWNSRQQELQKA